MIELMFLKLLMLRQVHLKNALFVLLVNIRQCFFGFNYLSVMIVMIYQRCHSTLKIFLFELFSVLIIDLLFVIIEKEQLKDY